MLIQNNFNDETSDFMYYFVNYTNKLYNKHKKQKKAKEKTIKK